MSSAYNCHSSTRLSKFAGVPVSKSNTVALYNMNTTSAQQDTRQQQVSHRDLNQTNMLVRPPNTIGSQKASKDRGMVDLPIYKLLRAFNLQQYTRVSPRF